MSRFPRWNEIPEALDPADFWQLFGDQEHEQLDFKKGVSADVANTIAAMAMTHGGFLIHGVADDRTIVGCPLSQNTREQITRRAAECDVDVQIRSLRVGDQELTITAVPRIPDRIVTTPQGRLLRRHGSQSVPLRGEAMARFVTARGSRAGEDEAVSTAEANHFDLKSVNAALDADGRPRSSPDEYEFHARSIEECLRGMNHS
ncbi:MAG: ATP-binding protein [Gammaproteobacteria bacterium]|nr:ATP-binding protein [Gammaproteobacteria bacterium]